MKNILVIDDDNAVRTSLNLLLKQNGFEVICIDCPKNAVEILFENSIHLILLDMNFSLKTSGAEGLQFLKEIKANNRKFLLF